MSESQVSKKIRMDMEDEAEFDHPKTMVDACKKLLNNEKNCDVFFVVGSQRERIGALTVILKARSPFFEMNYSSSPSGNAGSSARAWDDIVLKDVEPSTFRSFLEYIYTDVFTVTTAAQAVNLLHLATIYDVKPLVQLCKAIIERPFNLDELHEIYVTARKHNIPYVLDKFFYCIAFYFSQLGNSVFEKFDEATLIIFLKREDLCIRGEAELFSILLKWADKQVEHSTQDPKPERRDILQNLIPLVRFPTMTSKELATIVAPTNLIPEQTMLRLFMYINSDEDERSAIGQSLAFTKSRRRGMSVRVDFYNGRVRPGKGVYPKTVLRKSSNAVDVLTFKFSDTEGVTAKWAGRIVSLVLQGPQCSKGLFKNSSQVAEMLPIKVGISFCLARSYHDEGQELFPVNEEVFVNVGKDEVEVRLDKPWKISINRLYKITLRFLSDVYTVPEAIDDGSEDGRKRRDESLNLFNSTVLQENIAEKSTSGRVMFSNVSMSNGSSHAISGVTMEQAYLLQDSNTMSTGLHLLKALQLKGRRTDVILCL